MEGSVAGPAAAQGGEAAPSGEAQQGPDVGQLAQSLESMQAGQEELRTFLMSEPWAEQPAAEEAAAEPEPLDLSFLDPDGAQFDPEQVAQRLGSLIDQAAERQAQSLLQQHIEPLRQAQADQQRAQEAQMLVNELPEMGDPDIGPQVVAAAKQVAEANGHPELANQPWFWRTIYMAGRAAQTANEEGAETPAAAHLEGGSGARPGAQQVDLADQIFSSGSERRGRSALPFH